MNLKLELEVVHCCALYLEFKFKIDAVHKDERRFDVRKKTRSYPGWTTDSQINPPYALAGKELWTIALSALLY